jgi:hypothetical protein
LAPANLNLNNGKPNLFTNMIVGTYLKTNTVESFDKFIMNPTLENFKQIDQESFKKITQIEKFDSKYLNLLVSYLAKIYDESTDDSKLVINSASIQTQVL